MGQRGIVALLLVFLAGSAGCGRDAAPTKTRVARPTVASFVPGATDLIVGMGAADHLVAVSNYDYRREAIAGLLRVGDYQSMDWERLATIRPDIAIVFMSPDRMPAGLAERAAALNMRLVNVRTDRLSEVYEELQRLGELIGEREKADAAAKRLRARMEAVRQRVGPRQKVRTLIVRDSGAQDSVGHDNFLNDVLEIAGGENVLSGRPWRSVDREQIMAMKPDAVIVLLPEASEQLVAEAGRVWESMPHVPAVAAGNVHVLTQWWVMQPGMHLADLAEAFEQVLHR